MMHMMNQVLRPSHTHPQDPEVIPVQQQQPLPARRPQRPPPVVRSALQDTHEAVPRSFQTASGQAARAPPQVPPKPPRRALHPFEASSSSPGFSTDTEEMRRDDGGGRNWRVEDRRAGEFRDERAYVNWDAGSSPYYTRVERWNISFSGEDERNHVEGFLFRLEYLQRQTRCPWLEVLPNFHTLLSGRALEWYWMHVQ
ncbi:hypothetical protein KR054_009547, partial [Drosophila jambulina]